MKRFDLNLLFIECLHTENLAIDFNPKMIQLRVSFLLVIAVFSKHYYYLHFLPVRLSSMVLG